MKQGIVFLLVAVLLGAGVVGCTSHQVMNYNDQYFTLSGQAAPSLKVVDRAIKDAGAQRSWIMETAAPGHIVALVRVRRHVAKVDIRFDRKKFSIHYRDSENLNYNAAANTIHRNYNKWVTNLRNDIQSKVPLYFNAVPGQPASSGR